MKKILVIIACAATALTLSYCGGSKKAAKTAAAAPVAPPKTTYESSINTLVVGNCSPCHIPSKGGNKKPFDTYDKVKAGIADIISRIELNPGQRGFMPFKKEKLSDSTIALFKKWRDDGMLEH